MPEGTGILVDFNEVNEMAGVRAQRFRLPLAQIQLAEPQRAANDAARKAQSLVGRIEYIVI